jgi:hypothetical protein
MGAFGRLLIQKWGGNLKSYDGDRYVEKRTPSKEEIDEKERKEFLNEIKQRAIRYNNFDVYDETFFEFLDVLLISNPLKSSKNGEIGLEDNK